ncbi:proteasome subunit beta type-10-like isoform X6 [Acropora millepora]|uniref:proteasome subunit beta type-10-like isoform X6 n=1 Tax=Acropora millepora TaxID=45264 RepID=UPI001CF4235A|nr:proteasome subunit beta type-10-like isoform X6 [Acropora millepora]
MTHKNFQDGGYWRNCSTRTLWRIFLRELQKDTIVADKNCSKIHYIAPNIYCCGAGTAADTEYVTQLISSNIQLHSLSTGRQIPRLHKCCSCSGWCRLEWSNFTYSVPTWVMVHWLLCQCLSLDVNLTWNLMKLKKLVCDAIAAGIFNDLGSGSNVELCIVTKEDILTGEEQQASLLYIPFAFCCDKGHQTNCSGHDRNYRRGHGDVIYQLLCLPSFKI